LWRRVWRTRIGAGAGFRLLTFEVAGARAGREKETDDPS